MSAKTVLNLGTGKMSNFGGPADDGVGPNEGLALIGPIDLKNPFLARLFLSQQPEGTTGMARRLNPGEFYIAMRWDEVLKPFGLDYGGDFTVHKILRSAMVRLTNPQTGLVVFAQPVDYGPGDGKVVDGVQDPDTGRLADLSPGCACRLALQTDDLVTCELILPEVES